MSRRAPKPGAVLMTTDAEGRITEYHSFTCCHCGNPKVVPIDKKVEEVTDICRSCWRLHCLAPACCNGCASFERRIEAMEARQESLRSMGLA
jgi:hypothetical protein